LLIVGVILDFERRVLMPQTDSQVDPTLAPLLQSHVIFTDLDGLEGVLMDLNTKRYYLLNETASFVWRGLEKHKSTGKIAEEMTTLYEVTLEHATASVAKVLQEFSVNKLVRSA
jgi:hypothetical protein